MHKFWVLDSRVKQNVILFFHLEIVRVIPDFWLAAFAFNNSWYWNVFVVTWIHLCPVPQRMQVWWSKVFPLTIPSVLVSRSSAKPVKSAVNGCLPGPCLYHNKTLFYDKCRAIPSSDEATGDSFIFLHNGVNCSGKCLLQFASLWKRRLLIWLLCNLELDFWLWRILSFKVIFLRNFSDIFLILLEHILNSYPIKTG